MGEIIRYGCAPQTLRHALDEIGRSVGAQDAKYDDPQSGTEALCNRPRTLDFVAADVTGLITTKFGGLNNELAAGVCIFIVHLVPPFFFKAS